jgi:hypothetical protein
MAEQILPLNLATLLQHPEFMRQIPEVGPARSQLAAAMQSGALSPLPGAGTPGIDPISGQPGQSVMGPLPQPMSPMPPTLSGAENPPEITREPFRPRGRVVAQMAGTGLGAAGGGAVAGPVGAVAGGAAGNAGAGQIYDTLADYLMGTAERAPILSEQTAQDAAIGGIAGPVGPALRAAGSVAARAPATSAALSTAALTAANTASTSDAPPLSDRAGPARKRLQDATERRTAFENKERAELQSDINRFDPKRFDWKDKSAVGDAQALLRRFNIKGRDPKTGEFVLPPVDQKDGDITRSAVAEYRRRAEQKLREREAKIKEDVDAATAALTGADELDQRDIAARRMQELNEPTWTETLSRPGGIASGIVKGAAERYALGRAFRGARQYSNAAGDRLVDNMGQGDFNARAGNLNQFWSQGGGRNPPLTYTPGATPYPWTANPNQAARSSMLERRNPSATTPADRLYRPSVGERLIPPAVTGGFAGSEWVLGNQWIAEAQDELAAANTAIKGKTAPTEAELQRVADARHRLAQAEFLRSMGQGELLGMTATDAKMQVGMNKGRPNVGRAEAERADLDQMLKPPPPNPNPLGPGGGAGALPPGGRAGGQAGGTAGGGGPPGPLSPQELAYRKANKGTATPRGDWVPRPQDGGPPHVPGQTRYVSPEGQNEVFLNASGQWQRRNKDGSTPFVKGNKPPSTYRRVSGLDAAIERAMAGIDVG